MIFLVYEVALAWFAPCFADGILIPLLPLNGKHCPDYNSLPPYFLFSLCLSLELRIYQLIPITVPCLYLLPA